MGSRLVTETVISARVAERLLLHAREAGGSTDDSESGWSRITSGPEDILAVFKRLKLKSGFMLAGYRFQKGGNGNGFLYAVPNGTRLPAPDECPVDPTQFLSPPIPPMALDDVMDAIDGDGSPLSYFCASLLERELSEYGAMWHGCSWSTHELVTQDPFATGGCLRPKSGDADQMETQRDIENWRWLKSKPSRWEPRVKMGEGNVTVTFHTYSEYVQMGIYRHVDRYKPGVYRFKTKRIMILEGPGGYIF